MPKKTSLGRLVFICGDQLDQESQLIRSLDRKKDLIWMCEARSEAAHVWSHKARIALFFSAMRHFRDELRNKGFLVEYHQIDEVPQDSSFFKQLQDAMVQKKPDSLAMIEPGDYRVLSKVREICENLQVKLEIFEDDSFLISQAKFKDYAKGRRNLLLEHFYRMMRKRHGVLMDDQQPLGDHWNFDEKNRGSLPKDGPPFQTQNLSFKPDVLTRKVIEDVETHFHDHPGSLQYFAWPVTRKEALRALDIFINQHLKNFGTYQDAMWDEEPFLYHSLLSSALNLKLLKPLEVIRRAEDAFRNNIAPLNAVEGFIRQILGWREYIRGIYWCFMPQYLENNFFEHTQALPDFYWTGETEMSCLRSVLDQTLKYGYAHHIQRLMVSGLFALLLGVHPRKIHEWFLAIYVDAVEWVELPNVIGMSQFADGGKMSTKPYVASGQYIKRMSPYCAKCDFKPEARTGSKACPFTTLYWDFLIRNESKLMANPRMLLQLRNLQRISTDEKTAILNQAMAFRLKLAKQNVIDGPTTSSF